jgi:hypothetical protein
MFNGSIKYHLALLGPLQTYYNFIYRIKLQDLQYWMPKNMSSYILKLKKKVKCSKGDNYKQRFAWTAVQNETTPTQK